MVVILFILEIAVGAAAFIGEVHVSYMICCIVVILSYDHIVI